MALWHSLNLLFTAKDLASDTIRRMERSFGSLGKGAKMAAAGIAGAFVSVQGMQMGGAALKGMYDLAEGAGRFEQRLGQLKVAAQGAGEGFLEMARKTAIESGLTSRSDANAAVEGMTELAKAGMQARDVLGQVGQALQLVNASQGEIKVGEAAKMMASVQAAFAGQNVPSPDLIVNAAAKYAMETQASLSEVPKVLSRMLGGASLMEQDYADVMAAAAVARRTNTSPEMMSTSLRYIMQKLSGTKGMGLFQSATGVAVKDTAGHFKPLLQILAEMDDSPVWQRMDGAAQSDFLNKTFGSRQVSAIQGIRTVLAKLGVEVEKDGKRYTVFGQEAARSMLEGFRDSAKTNKILEYQAADIKTFGGLIDWIGAKLATLKVQFGEAFLPIVRPIAVAINQALEWVGKFINMLPTGAKTAAAAFAIFGAVAFTTAMAVGFLASALAVALPILFAIKGFLLTFFIVPALIAGAAMTALALAGVALYAAWKNNIGGMGDMFSNWAKKATLAFDVMKQLFERGGTWGSVDAQIMAPENSGLLRFLQNVWLWLNRIKSFAKGVWEGFRFQLDAFDKPIKILMESMNRLLGLFGVSAATADQNREAYTQWGQSGRNLGHILATVAQMGIMLLVVAIETLADVMQAFGIGAKDPTAGKRMVLNAQSYAQLMGGDYAGAFKSWSELKALEREKDAVETKETNELLTPLEQSMSWVPSWTKKKWADARRPKVDTSTVTPIQTGPMPAASVLQATAGQGTSSPSVEVNIKPQESHTHLHLDGKEVARSVSSVMWAAERKGGFKTVPPFHLQSR